MHYSVHVRTVLRRLVLHEYENKMASDEANGVKFSREADKPKKEQRCFPWLFLMTVLAVILAIIIYLVLRPSPFSEDAHGNEDHPLVHTAKGVLKGVRERSVGGRSFLSFYAIPYARPPLGRLRFQDPEEEEAWTGVRNASSQPEQCLQISFTNLKSGVISEEHVFGSEDCLYLNVFTPELQVAVAEGLPVMVYLHGGGYVAGAAHQYQPHVLLDHQVVMVVPQFRLGTLGFLSTEDEVMSGNYMLKDQLAALRWVHRNIRDFGGDPHRLTLFGESAGGTSSHILSLSPRAQGLFSRVILHSGNALSPFVYGRRHRQVAEDTARSMGHLGKLDSKNIRSFLQTVPAKSLVLVNVKYIKWYIFPFVMGPRIDGDVIPTDLYEMTFRMACPPWQLMTGLTAHDGALLTHFFYLRESMKTRLMEDFTEIGPMSLMLADDVPDPETKATALYHYYLGKNINLELSDNFTKLFTDYMFGVPNDLVALTHATCTRPHRHTFTYEFTHRGERSMSDLLNVTVGKNWVTHIDDLIYLFPVETMLKGLQPLASSEDLALREIMTKLWVNFAYTGNPTPDASLGITWEAIEHENLKYLDLNPSPTMKPDHRRKVREFYRTVLPEQNKFMEKLITLNKCTRMH